MHLAPASFDPQLIKEEILQYCKGLIASTKNNHALVEQSFHIVLSEDEVLKHHTLYLVILSIVKETSRRTLFNLLLERPLSGTANQPFCCQTPGNKLLDSHDTTKESTNL